MITESTAQEKLSLNEAYMSLSWQDYLTLSQYMQDVVRYIEQQNKVIEFYEKNH